MQKFVVRGGTCLRGEVRVSGAKNAALPIMASCLLSSGQCVVKDIPNLSDISVMLEVLNLLGANVTVFGTRVEVDARSLNSVDVPRRLTERMRASNLVMGPLLGRFGQVRISAPGGCAIGDRPMDLHEKGFKALGAKVLTEKGITAAEALHLTGAEIHLDSPSVGATENIMMAATLARGTTIIRNAAKEPEIVDLQNFLNGMGARVRGAGTDTIRVDGVARLGSVEHSIIPDRVECGTHMVAAAITGGDVFIRNVIPEHLEALTAKLCQAGAEIKRYNDGLAVRMVGPPRPVEIVTLPYPGFPTDMQPQVMALMCLARGSSRITETIFSKRYQHVDELVRMGAWIRVDNRTALIEGVPRLSGATVQATDLRAGACLLLAGFAAEGVTTVEQVEHLDRGYEHLEQKYNCLGANIERANDGNSGS